MTLLNISGKTLLLLTTLLLFSCTSPDTPEEQIEEYIASVAKAFESRKVNELQEYIAEDYYDVYGNSQNNLLRIAAGYFLRNQRFFLTIRINGLEIKDNLTHAEFVTDVAINQSRYAEGDIRILQGELHRLKIELSQKDGSWLLQTLEWQRIGAEDYSDVQ